ncbi:hypothetical protein SAM_1967 [Streptococcus agalactiae CJB111]|nr:hypothetical protein SAM_1967 [Streptococcus agalactiae CJB111]
MPKVTMSSTQWVGMPLDFLLSSTLWILVMTQPSLQLKTSLTLSARLTLLASHTTGIAKSTQLTLTTTSGHSGSLLSFMKKA